MYAIYDGTHAVTFKKKVGNSTVSKHTWDDWHLIPSKRPQLGPPNVKTNYVDIPGAHGHLDLSNVLTGAPRYENRSGSMEFILMNKSINSEGRPELEKYWYERYSEIMNFLHGQVLDMVLDDDPDWTWKGRFNVSGFESQNNYSTITISFDVYPFKLQHIVRPRYALNTNGAAAHIDLTNWTVNCSDDFEFIFRSTGNLLANSDWPHIMTTVDASSNTCHIQGNFWGGREAINITWNSQYTGDDNIGCGSARTDTSHVYRIKKYASTVTIDRADTWNGTYTTINSWTNTSINTDVSVEKCMTLFNDSYKINCLLYRLYVWDKNNMLIHDYEPVYDENVAKLKDHVTDELFTPSATGFTLTNTGETTDEWVTSL